MWLLKSLSKNIGLIFFLLIAHNFVWSQELSLEQKSPIVNIQYCLDIQSNLTIQDIDSCDFVSRKKLSNGALSESTIWIQVRTERGATSPAGLVIRVGPHFLKDIALFQKRGGEWIENKAGRLHSSNDSHVTLGGYAFEIPNEGESEQTVYLRIQKSGIGVILLDVVDFSLAGVDSISQQLEIGVHIGALLLVLIFSVFSYLINRDTMMFRFSCLTLDLLMCILSGSGFLAKYIFSQQPWLDVMFFSWVTCLRLACWVWFSQAFIEPYHPPAWYKISNKALYILVGIAMLLASLDKGVLLQQVLLFGFLVASIVQLAGIQFIPNSQRLLRRIVLLGYAFVNGLFFVALAIAAATAETGHMAIVITRAVDFVTPIALLAIVGFRTRLIRLERDTFKTENLRISMNLKFERELLKDRRVLLDMLAHELKNPLASISLAINSLRKHFSKDQVQEQRRLHNIDQSIRSMDSVIERCILMNQIDQKSITASICEIELSKFFVSLTETKEYWCRLYLNLDDAIVVRADGEFLRIILSNLLENAAKYSPPGSLIDITLTRRTEKNTSCARLIISNFIGEYGAPDQNQIFNRFYRNPLAQSLTGSGLGLHLVKELCTVLFIEIRCVSGQQKVVFTLDMPLRSI